MAPGGTSSQPATFSQPRIPLSPSTSFIYFQPPFGKPDGDGVGFRGCKNGQTLLARSKTQLDPKPGPVPVERPTRGGRGLASSLFPGHQRRRPTQHTTCNPAHRNPSARRGCGADALPLGRGPAPHAVRLPPLLPPAESRAIRAPRGASTRHHCPGPLGVCPLPPTTLPSRVCQPPWANQTKQARETFWAILD